MGKTIAYYDSFSGSHSRVEVASIEVYEDSVRVRPDRDHWGIFIEKRDLDELLNSGHVIKDFTIEGCSCKEEWHIL